jgi:glutamate dehydrogenase
MQNLIKQVVEFSRKLNLKENSGKNFESFVKDFYHENKLTDFENYSTEALYNFALSAFKFINFERKSGFIVRIYNPQKSQDNFESPYTIIEIINNDMPFLVDSTVAFLDKQGIKINNIIHPVLNVNRDNSGKFIEIANSSNSKQESLIQLHIDKIVSQSEINVLKEIICKIIETVGLVVEDFDKMKNLVKKSLEQIENSKKIVKNSKENDELKEFLNWILDGNFVLLGAKEFDIKSNKENIFSLFEVAGSGFGVFRSEHKDFRPEVVNSSPEEVGDSVHNPYIVEVIKSRYRSKIHRSTNAERIRVQKISPEGNVIGEYRFVGLFTSSAYFSSIFSIPLLRNKVTNVIENSEYVKGSHNYKDLISTLESYPRDELFQINEADLLKNATGIVSIAGRSIVKFFARKDKFNRFVSCLIYTPRDRSNSEMREKIKEFLCEVFHGEVADSFVQITESNLIRFHLIIRTNNGIPKFDENFIEHEIIKMTKIWSDELIDAIKAKFEDEKRILLHAKYKNSFSVSYVNRFDAKVATDDIEFIEDSFEKNSPIFNLYKNSDLLDKETIELKIYAPHQEIILSSIMPILESFGFNVIKEHTYIINVEEDLKNRSIKKAWIHYFHLNISKNGGELSEKIKNNFEIAIDLIWKNVTKVGALNKLVVSCDLDWKQIFMLRGYFKYLHQTGFRFNQGNIADCFVRNPQICKSLVELFEIKFDPHLKISLEQRQNKIEEINKKINDDLSKIKDVADDSIIRRFLGVVNATLRTNYYQLDNSNQFKGYVSFKFDCKKVPNLPLPLPYAEIFVYSPKVEAIHLRGGKVARGGLRWSDRQEDFRTEVLGLMKAQMTKNAVIVPVGSKGGFVVKSDTSKMSRDELQQEGISCYKTFLRGLLDITDNVIDGKVEHPHNVIMHDAPDPYLVVAADKGTATFSDTANGISQEYNFWLGDAFASGGSVGYDHKKMGITAKGAWISVMRHFREFGVDTQSQDFTCVGIGDLAGDVFGNGMLLSKHIKLVAAFNHIHIFLDPNPDPQKSFKERERMFNLPRSTWMDYDKSLISRGGGVFERSAKSIAISPEIKEILKISEDELSPTDLMRAILKAPVDLLWNGGIGTYVKSQDETNQDVGDKANDLLRINGNELNCKVVGEGGNLGFTQKGRIEFARNSGRINTDAMDNSAGVDCSDHEVNIKIALISAMKSKKINLEERNKILEAMTDDVSALVLSDNRLQTQAISIAQSLGASSLGEQSQFLDSLEKSGLLNRAIEFLPNRKEIDKLQIEQKGLTRPELCVMLAYSKMDIYNKILASDLVKDQYFEKELLAYFPKLMQQKLSSEILNHQLRNEIIATQITNFVVNRIGITFINQICQDSGFSLVEVVKNFIIACDSFRIREIWQEVENLDGKVPLATQMQMFLSANKLIERSVLWLLRNQIKGSLAEIISRFQKIADELLEFLPSVLAKASLESFVRKIERYCINKVDRKLAERVASMDPVASAFDISEIALSTKLDIKIIAEIYFAVGTRFSLKWLRSRLNKITLNNHWQKLSSKTVLEDLYSYQMRLAKDIAEFSLKNKNKSVENLIEDWSKNSIFLTERFDNFILELKNEQNPDLSMFVVALNRIKPLVN